MKKKISFLLILSLILSFTVACTNRQAEDSPIDDEERQVEENQVKVNVIGLKGPTGMGMAKIIEDNKEKDNYGFEIVNSVDEISPKLLTGQVDIAALPANLASIIYNKSDGQVVSLGINTLGVLYIVENGDSIRSIDDLKGSTVYSSGKGASPEFALNYILEGNGIDPLKDLNIEYKSEHTEVLTAILTNEGGVGLLPQPFVSVALAKDENLRIALDLNDQWDRVNEKTDNISSLLTGVIVARKEFIEEYPNEVEKFIEDYKKSVDFTNEYPEEAAKLIAKLDIVPESIALEAIPYSNITFIGGRDMEDKLSGYLEILYKANPKSVGGKMPSEDFYYIGEGH